MINYGYGHERVRHALEFSESIDSKEGKALVTIGWIGHEPKKYVASKNHPAFTLNVFERCTLVDKKLNLVPEIDWFFTSIISASSSSKFNSENPHLVGPTGAYLALEYLDKVNLITCA